MKCKYYCQKIREALINIKTEAQYVGEDGGMVTNCKTKIGAWRRFRKLTREQVGDEEAKEIKMEDIMTAYFHLALETSKEQRESMNIDDDGWYIDSRSPSPVQVWFYNI